ncbi:MAG TPA: HIT family protein [Candidatus Saccharimonadales bacterium]|nr:HIT family protein [Candidatus Saccharimonadales bacterium]
MDRTIFDEIIEGNIPSWKVWEDEGYLAFLTPFANTPGATVVIPKKNPGDYIFSLDLDDAKGLIEAATTVAKLLEKAFDVPKVAMVFEGEGVAHVHAKLYPMHNVQSGKHVQSVHHQEFYTEYPGFISTVEGPRMSDEELSNIQKKIQEAAKR